MIKKATGKRKRTKSEKTIMREKTTSFIILFVFCAIWCIPFLYMIGSSFKSDLDLQTHPELFFPSSPSEWTFKHYTGFIVNSDGQLDNLPKWIFNSIWSSCASVLLTVLVDLITAYALVFLKFKGKKFIVAFFILWMTVPSVIGTAPGFAIYSQIRNSLQSEQNSAALYIYIYMWLILPGLSGIFNMLLMRSFFLSIPKEIVESSKCDGASNMLIFRKIVCPLAKSTIMLIVLFVFTGSWNNLVFPQLLLSGENYGWRTITVALTVYTGGNGWDATGIAMATSVFSMIPIIIVFMITQNKMIDGMASTGIKG